MDGFYGVPKYHKVTHGPEDPPSPMSNRVDLHNIVQYETKTNRRQKLRQSMLNIKSSEIEQLEAELKCIEEGKTNM